MRQFVVATAVVAFLAAGLAEGQLKSAVPPGAPQPPEVKVQATVPVPQQPLESARRITREEAIKLVKQKKAIYVDVRARDQFDLGHIKGAYSVPLAEVISRLRELPPNTFLITYCA
jgi:Rhodanese-like domain.